MKLKKILAVFTILLAMLILVGCQKPSQDDNGFKQIDEPVNKPPKKILVIGNSFSHNALEYFMELEQALNLSEELIVGHIHIGGSSLETHAINAQTDVTRYTYNKFIKGQESPAFPQVSVKKALQDEVWDMVSIQQVSGLSGIASAYTPHLKTLVEYIKTHAKNKNVDIAFHMTWAYQKDSSHQDFVRYANDQMVMYDSIIATTQYTVLANSHIKHVIPTGTAIQNLRTSIVSDHLTDDGYHLNTIGKITASLTWLKYLFNANLDQFEIPLDFADAETKTEINGAIIEAVNHAIEEPFKVTESVEYPYKEEVRFMDKLHLLAIGNSFTANAFEFLPELLKDAGVESFVVAYLYRGGTSLQYHLGQLNINGPSYSYRKYVYDGTAITSEVIENQTIKYGLDDEVWDIITVQQVSQDSGDPNTFDPILSTFVNELKRQNTNKETLYGYHMTWAYHENSNHSQYGKYNHDQMTMYNAIINTTKDKVVKNPYIDFIIPSGTAIQNARNTRIGDNVTIPDGYHLNRLGEYIAGLMWVKQITNVDIEPISFAPTGLGIRNYFYEIKRSVNEAYENPFILIDKVVVDPPKETDPISYENYTEVPFTYDLGFWITNQTQLSRPPSNEDPNALHYKYVGVYPISKTTLPIHSVVKLDPGFRARIVYFTKSEDTYTCTYRLEPLAGEIILTEDMWGNYEYIGFNISREGTPNIAHEINEVANHMTLYKPN